MIESQTQQTLFEDPQQLLTIRDHLSNFLQPQPLATPVLLDRLAGCIANLLVHPAKEVFEVQQECQMIMEELRQVASEESANVVALSHLTIKMIDYIGEKQHHFDSEIQNYEHNLDYLRGQLDFQTNKNITIEGDVEMFREQLIAAQNQLEEIAEDDRDSLEEPSIQRDEEERERRIEDLENELEKIKEQLRAYKFQTMVKRSEVSLGPKSLAPNMSQKLIFGNYSKSPPESKFEEHLQQELISLRQTVHQLQLQNNELQFQLSERPARRRESVISQPRNLLHQLSSCQLKQNMTQKMLPHLSSIANIPNSQKVCYLQLNEDKPLHPEKSAEKFHTLSSDVSSKSFEVNLSHFNIDSHITNLIYVGDGTQDQGAEKVEKTGETEHSIPHIGSEVEGKVYRSQGVNTEQQLSEMEQIRQCLCSVVKKSLGTVVDSFFTMRDFAVKRRIVHGHRGQ